MVFSPLTQVNLGDIIYYEEDVFCMEGDRYKCIGRRCCLAQVLRPTAIPGEVIIKIVNSIGVAAFGEGVEIDKPVNCLLRGKMVSDTQNNISSFQPGGHLAGTKNGKEMQLDSAKQGGISKGSSHDNGGIKGSVGTEKRPIEFEGDEIILTAAVASNPDTYEFQGKQMTGKQIASQVNQDNGGVSFADGGEAHSCRCSGRSYKFGGNTISDRDIVKYINFMSLPVNDRILLLKK